MLFWLIAGVAIGYFFKPQLDKVVVSAIRHVKEIRQKMKDDKNHPNE